MSALPQAKKRRVAIPRRNSSGNNTKKIVLEKVIGNTVSHNSAFACNPETGEIAFPAGCLVVIYNAKRNKQIRFLSNKESKVISFLCFSSNGKYLAVGESGHRPAVVVWDTTSWQIISELRGHKFGISCGAFSPNLKYLVTVGFQHDGYLYLWDWKAQQSIACNKTTTKVHSVAFSEDGAFFVTAGLRHMKFWYLDSSGNFKSNNIATDKAPRVAPPTGAGQLQLIEGRSGVLGNHRDAIFVDAVCGKGAASGSTFCATSTGMLCLFSSNRLMEKWVNLKTSRVFALAISESIVACACADGVVRLFDSVTLEYINTLPRPNPIGKENKGIAGAPPAASATDIYPDALAVRLSMDGQRITVIYTDRSMMMWDIRNPKKVGLSRSFMAHCGCIWDIAMCPSAGPLLEGSFVTCSADNTIRVWNLDAANPLGLNASMNVEDVNASFSRSIYSKELVHTIHVTDDFSAFKMKDTADSRPESASVVGEGGIRCVAISPDGKHVASGDKQGNLRVYDTSDFSCVEFKEAHDAEILTMDFSVPATRGSESEEGKKKPALLLGTASRDRLVHIFDAEKGYELISTLDDHSSSITALRFACDGSRLLTCSADKSIIFRSISYDGSPPPSPTSLPQSGFPSIKRYHQATVPYGTLYDLDVDTTQKYAVVVGQDKRLSIYGISDGKVKRSYKAADPDAGDVLKVALDPAGVYAVTSCSNKVIRLYDFFSGECLARMAGHSELITGVKFTRDCRRIISVAGDGCIFVWKLSAEFTKNMKARLAEQNPTRNEEVVSSTPRPIPVVPPNLSPIASRRGPDDSTETMDESYESVSETGGGTNPLNNSELSRFKFSETALPAWAKGGTKQEESQTQPRPNPNPKGRWALRADDEIALYSELGDEDRPVVKWADRADKRRLTIEPDSDMWAEPSFRNNRPGPTRDDGTLISDVTDGQPLTKLASSLEDGDAVLQDDDEESHNQQLHNADAHNRDDADMHNVGTIGALEDDDDESDSNDEKGNDVEQEESEPVYFSGAPGEEQQTKANFMVEDKPASPPNTLQSKPKDDEEFEDGSTKDFGEAKKDNDDDELDAFRNIYHKDDLLRTNYENLGHQEFAKNPLRLSISRKFLNKTQSTFVEGHNSEGDPRDASKTRKPKEPLAKEVERTRERLARLGIVIPTRGEQQPQSPPTQTHNEPQKPLPTPPATHTPPSSVHTPSSSTRTPSPTFTHLDNNLPEFKLVPTSSTSGATTGVDIGMGASIPRSQSPPCTLPRPLSEYEQSLKTLSSAFSSSLALFQEVQDGSDPMSNHLRNEFSTLFNSLQAQLGISGTPTTQFLQQQQQQTQSTQDPIGHNLEKYSDLLVDRVLQKIGSLDFGVRLLQSIQASQSIRPSESLMDDSSRM